MGSTDSLQDFRGELTFRAVRVGPICEGESANGQEMRMEEDEAGSRMRMGLTFILPCKCSSRLLALSKYLC